LKSELATILDHGANQVWHLGLTEAQLDQFERFADILTTWNSTRMNLTRLTSPRDIAVKHFLDSLLMFKAVRVQMNARIIDVGTGAGLPGLALKIARPDLAVTLLDSTAKKLDFCRAVVGDLGLTGVDIVHARAVDAGRNPVHRNVYDIVVARALAPLAKLLPWCAPFARPGGRIVALKGSGVDSELPDARPAAYRLGLRLHPPIAVALPEAEEETIRQVVVASAR
jgi:16S rRNA (guanine527-N7)-methyltransferase